MTAIGTRVAHEKTASEFCVVEIRGYFLPSFAATWALKVTANHLVLTGAAYFLTSRATRNP
jgi:hypothetical protein